MTIPAKDKLSFQTSDSVTGKALRLVDSLARDRTLEQIQRLVTDGRLEELFPDLFVDEPTPALGAFDDMVEAPAQRLTDQQFEELLERS